MVSKERRGGKSGKKLVFRRTWQVIKWGYPIKFLIKPVHPPKFTRDYMEGYISGVFTGDGCVKHYQSKRSYFVRLALKDTEAIERVVLFMEKLGVKEMPKVKLHKMNTSILRKIEFWNKKCTTLWRI